MPIYGKILSLNYSFYSLTNFLKFLYRSTEVGKTKESGGSFIRIEQSKPLVLINANCLEPVLVNEWYKLTATITNTDDRDYDKISVTCQLQTSDSHSNFTAHSYSVVKISTTFLILLDRCISES